MCGIIAALGVSGDREKNRRDILRRSRLLRHRGPDQTGTYESSDGTVLMSFERLMIVDPTDGGKQPYSIPTPEGNIAWAVNCEIYNHMKLRETHLAGHEVPSACDSAIVGHLYAEHGAGPATWNALDGIFAAVVVDERDRTFAIARDPLGVCSLYWGRGKDGSVWVSSEMKALVSACETVSWFPPGHVVRGRLDDGPEVELVPERWYKPDWLVPEGSPLPVAPFDASVLRATLISAVEKRLMADAPLGVLLSGGLDSSLVASIAARAVRRTNGPDGEKLKTFAVGVRGSPDLLAAREVADFIGTDHHEFVFTPQEGIDALEDVVWHIESVEQVRSAVPMYLLARRIKAMGIKVVLSGEGADEAFGGYLYFHKAPGPREMHEETVRLLARLHQWDVLRANKAPFSFGVETRVPFLDKGLLALAMSYDPALKLAGLAAAKHAVANDTAAPAASTSGQPGFVVEKNLLRAAFDTPEDPFLPASVLWRQKEQFSDGVGYSWVDGLRDYSERVVSPAEWAARAETFPDHPPRTKEYYILRRIFESHFPHPHAFDTVPKGLSIACSTPEAISWDDEWAGTHEISGRAIASVHAAAEGFKVRADGELGEEL